MRPLGHTPCTYLQILASRNNHCRSKLSLLFDCQKSLVCILKWKYCDLRANIEIMGDLQKVARVLSSHIRHTPYLALAPKQFVIVKARHVIKMNCIDCHHSPFTQTSEGTDYDLATGSEGGGTVERDGRLLIFFADPRRAEGDSSFPMGFSSSHNIDVALPGL